MPKIIKFSAPVRLGRRRYAYAGNSTGPLMKIAEIKSAENLILKMLQKAFSYYNLT